MKPWRLTEALEWGSRHLGEQGIEKPRLEARLLLGHALEQGQEYLYLNSEEVVPEERLSSFRKLVERRRERIPWQYLLGHSEFMSLDLLVNEEVMIPRPETEILVEAALNKLGIRSSVFGIRQKPTIVNRQPTTDNRLPVFIDLGTGSGNIAIALAKFPCRVYALDISAAALQVAGVNARRCAVDRSITFLQDDIFALGKLEGLEGKADLLISNPPYVATCQLDELQPEVSRFEPRLALDGGKDGLNFYPPLIERATVFLHRGGYLALEVGIGQAEVVKGLIIEASQFCLPEVIKDYAGIERVIVARKR